jgi:hypothetical protein
MPLFTCGFVCRLQDQLRVAGQAQAAADARAQAAEAQLDAVRREADARASTIRWLESQVCPPI